jgi:ABC-2 type transport system ATP-binding protein
MSIVVRDLCKTFGPIRAVENVTFEIPSSGIVGLIGPNGAGKSTILRILSTFLSPTSGRAAVCGFDCATQSESVRQQIGYLPETPPGQSESRIDEYLTFRAALKGIARRGRRAEIDRCLEACQLTNVRRRLIARLSQGFRRRVGLADALLGCPKVLILDEPTIGLDPLQVRHTRELLSNLAQDSTILLSTHLLAEAEGLCHRVLVLLRGGLVSDIRMDELHAGTGFEIELDGPFAECEQALHNLPRVISVECVGTSGRWRTYSIAGDGPHLREEAARECLRRGWNLRELRATSRTLEDHFVRVAMRARRESA